MSNEIANWIAAIAALICLWRARGNAALSVRIEECAYDQSTERFSGQILFENSGSVVADSVALRASFNTVGLAFVEDFRNIAVQPKSHLARFFSHPMPNAIHRLAQTDGNRLRALIQGSYHGGGRYSYNDLLQYENGRFGSVWANHFRISPVSALIARSRSRFALRRFIAR